MSLVDETRRPSTLGSLLPEEKDSHDTADAVSGDNIGVGITHDRVTENRILRKVDLHLIAPLWFLFLVGFMDRIGLGNVVLLGLSKDLHLKSNQFNLVLQAFFITYVVFDMPVNVMLKRSRPSYMIAALAFLWGIVSLCQGLVKGFGGLVACRLFIGAFEAGFTPATIYLMSTWYKRHEFQFRFNIYWTAGVTAGSVAGLLAYGVNHMNGVGGLAGWRWVLIIEGMLACTLAAIIPFVLADWPHHARFLSAQEKAFWLLRTEVDTRGIGKMERLDRKAVLRTIKDWKIWCGSLMYLSVCISGNSTALFIPSILHSLGYTGIESQVQSIPIWAVAAVVTFAVGFFSDKAKHRYGFILFGLSTAMIGYAILLAQGPLPEPEHLGNGLPLNVRYMAVFFIATGTTVAQPVIIVWQANNLSGSYKLAIGSALQIVSGSFSGIIASNSFVAGAAPRYFVGYSIVLGSLCICSVLSTLFAWGLLKENQIRDRGGRDHRLQLDKEELENLGDDHPVFRFTL